MSIADALQPHVSSGDVPGLAALVAHGTDVVDVAVLGSPAVDDPTPLRRDAIFRIASISKPIVAVLAMVLVDDGVLRLDDRVDTYLPELADRRVLTSIGAALDDTVAADRPLTVEDLLSFRMGFGTSVDLDWSGPGLPIQQAERELGLCTLGPPWPPPAFDDDEWIRRFATLPLMAQPARAVDVQHGTAGARRPAVERAARSPAAGAARRAGAGPVGHGRHRVPRAAGIDRPTDGGVRPDRRRAGTARPGRRGELLGEPTVDAQRRRMVGVDARRPVGVRPVDGRRRRRPVRARRRSSC